MPRYSVTVTVRVDADNDDEASARVTDALCIGNSNKGGSVDDFFTYSVEEVENEDEGQEEER